jgi:enamine deaminase RidA (YjgF/YER057c/UK114 family)
MALAHTAQVFPLNRRGRVRPNSDITAQTELVLQHLDTALKSAGSDLSQIVKLNVYLMENHTASEVQAVLARKFSGEAKPAVCFVTGELPEPNARVAMDAVAIVPLTPSLSPSDGERDGVRGIASVAVLPAGSRIYVSGMADTNALPDATRKTLEKLIAAIGNLGLAKKDVVQLKAFLQPMSKVGVVREQIVRFFDGHAPPVVFVDWISPAPNPPIEIELIAAAKGDFSKEADSMSFLTPSGTSDSKVFRRVARVNHGKLIYISGLYGMKAQDAGAQVREIFGSLGGVLKTTDSDFEHLAKATYYVTDNDASNKLNDIRPEFYHPQRAPAASKAKVKGVGATSKTVTMDMIAVTK